MTVWNGALLGTTSENNTSRKEVGVEVKDIRFCSDDRHFIGGKTRGIVRPSFVVSWSTHVHRVCVRAPKTKWLTLHTFAVSDKSRDAHE